MDDAQAYRRIESGKTIWQADGRKGRNDRLHYRESLHARYQGPYSSGKMTAWDGIMSNAPGLVVHDPKRGFDLTMRAGDALEGGYTTRDIASAAHCEDYRPAYEAWERDCGAHPELLLPGRAALFHGVRFDLLSLGPEQMGSGGCIIQDWIGLEFDTMEKFGQAKSDFAGGGFVFFNQKSGNIKELSARFRPRPGDPFAQPPREGLAPLYCMFSRQPMKIIYVDPDVPHELAIHWLEDGVSLALWCDGVCTWFLTAPAINRRCGFHVDIFHDNNPMDDWDVHGGPGHADKDQAFSVEGFEIRAV